MEIFNENKVVLPDLPGTASPKERLAHEVAGRIVEQMNRTEPDSFHKAFFAVVHHGGQVAKCDVRLVNYATEDRCNYVLSYKDGGEVYGEVLKKLSGIGRIDLVRVGLCGGILAGTFAPDR